MIDHLRSRSGEKRGGGLPFVALEEIEDDIAHDDDDLDVDWIAVHDALTALEGIDNESARIVELKFFSS